MANKVACYCCKRMFGDHLVLTCSLCQNMFGNTCVGLSSSEVRIISSKKSLSWSCGDCEKIGSDIQSLRSVIVSLQREILDLKATVRLNTDGCGRAMDDESFEELVSEIEERQKRRKNVIIYGMGELETSKVGAERISHDKTIVGKLFEDIDPNVLPRNENFRVFRLGKYDPNSQRPRPLRVTLNSSSDTIALLKKSKTIRSISKYKNVIISSDRTPSQLTYFKKIKEEVEKRKSEGENVVLKFVRGVPTVSSLN